MWLLAQMIAWDTPLKEFISLCLPWQVDGQIGVVQHDEDGSGLFWAQGVGEPSAPRVVGQVGAAAADPRFWILPNDWALSGKGKDNRL